MPCGTIADYADFNAEEDSEALNAAMQGLGTDEDTIIAIISKRSNSQRQELATKFAQMWGKELVDSLKDELAGHFEDVVVQLFTKADEYDAWCLHDAMSGAGTTESTLIEIMCSRSNDEIANIKDKYKELYDGKDLDEELQSDTGGSLKHLLFALAQGARAEDDVCGDAAAEDAQALLDAGEATWGTDESRFNVVFASRSFSQLLLIMEKYEEISPDNQTLEAAVSSEMSGDIEEGMLAIIDCARNMQKFFAKQLYKSMKGAGTNDKALIRLMISRSEVDLADVKEWFFTEYEQTLEDFIRDDCSGDYKKILVELCLGNQ